MTLQLSHAVPAYVAEDIADVLALLDKAQTPAPTLHPDVNAADTTLRWNGWNLTLVIGTDAEGHFILIERWHFASGRCDHSVAIDGGMGHLSPNADDVLSRINYPVYLSDPRSIIRFPAYTPKEPA